MSQLIPFLYDKFLITLGHGLSPLPPLLTMLMSILLKRHTIKTPLIAVDWLTS